MSDKILSLSKARKARTRAEKEQKAAENRRLHGRTKAEKLNDRKATDTLVRLIDGHKRDPRDDGAPS